MLGGTRDDRRSVLFVHAVGLVMVLKEELCEVSYDRVSVHDASPETCSFLVVVDGPREPRERDGKRHAGKAMPSRTSGGLLQRHLNLRVWENCLRDYGGKQGSSDGFG